MRTILWNNSFSLLVSQENTPFPMKTSSAYTFPFLHIMLRIKFLSICMNTVVTSCLEGNQHTLAIKLNGAHRMRIGIGMKNWSVADTAATGLNVVVCLWMQTKHWEVGNSLLIESYVPSIAPFPHSCRSKIRLPFALSFGSSFVNPLLLWWIFKIASRRGMYSIY